MGEILDNSETSSPVSFSHKEGLPTTYPSNSEATVVATAEVSEITDQKNPTSAKSHFTTAHVDENRTSDNHTPPGSKTSVVTGGMSTNTSHDSRGVQASAGTDVDHPEVMEIQDLKNQFFTLGKYFLSYINVLNIIDK